MNAFNQQKIRHSLLWISGLLLLFATSCVIDPNHGDVNNTRYSASENFSNRVQVTTQQYLDFRGINGTVEIVGTDQPDILDIWGERRVESDSKADAEANLQRLSVEITVNEDGIVVETRQPDETHGRNYIVNYHLRVPRSWFVYAENINGNTSVETFDNALEVGLTNGNLDVISINGGVSAALVNGNLNIQEVSGSVIGALVNGNISGKVYLPLMGTCKLSAVNGNVALSIPQTTSAHFSSRVSNGGISLANLTLQNAVTTPTSLSGVLGSGNGTIDLQTVNGSIVVTGF